MRQATRGNDHDIGVLGLDGPGFGPGVEMDRYAELFTLSQAPVYDANHFAPTLALRGQPNLAACPVGSFEDHNVVPAFARDPSRFEAGRTSTDDDDFAAKFRFRNIMRHGLFTTGCGVVN